MEKGVIILQFVDVYLYEKKNDTNPVRYQEIEVTLDSDKIQTSAPYFGMELNIPEECENIITFDGELIRLKTIILDDDEIPESYLCYDIVNWDFSGKHLIVSNPEENVHKYSIPFK